MNKRDIASAPRPLPLEHTRGILHPGRGLAAFQLERHAPSVHTAGVVERYWTLRWSLLEPFEQETLPHPTVNLAFEPTGPGGATEANVHGVCTRRFMRRIEGAGRVLGVKFRAGAFHAMCGRSVSALTDRVVPARDLFGPGCDALVDELDRLASNGRDEDARVAHVDRWLAGRLATCLPELDAVGRLAVRAVEVAAEDRSLLRAEALAARLGIGLRALQRLFREHVGVTPKWVLARFRLHEAAERLAAGSLSLADLAHELGYADQAHFARDFSAQVGQSPASYATAQVARRRSAPTPQATIAPDD